MSTFLMSLRSALGAVKRRMFPAPRPAADDGGPPDDAPPPEPPGPPPPPPFSVDEQPWRHPCLTSGFLDRFAAYSRAVKQWAREQSPADAPADARPLDVGFCVNLAQNMYNWANLAAGAGARARVYLHAWDERALSLPQWEEFDGDWPDVLDGRGFLEAFPEIEPRLPCETPPLEALGEFRTAWEQAEQGDRRLLLRLQARCPSLRLDSLFAYGGDYSYLLPWAEKLAGHDVSCSAYFPVPSYLSGKPYCAFATGDDLQSDCGRSDRLGRLIGMAFNGARFLLISNPHAVGHCRRLGFGNGLHLPYLVDDAKYSPGEGRSRREWEMGCGRGFYVLSTARLDDTVKGNAGRLFDELAALVRRNPQVRFVSLAWGRDVERFRRRVEEAGLSEHFLLLSPVGKRRLIDYYRSADCVLDQFVYGYYGATALEAMSVGKPVVMRLREDHYRPLYGGDVAPVLNCQSAAEAAAAIDSLARQPEEARRRGEQARAWLLRHHGRAAAVPDLMALLGVTHRGLELPPELRSQNPFHEDLTDAEREYHESCLRPAG